MSTLWDQATPIKDSKSISKWNAGITVVQETPRAAVATPALWDQAKPVGTTAKPSWNKGVVINSGPKSMLQRVFDFSLGEGASTGEFDRMTVLGKTLDLMGRPGYAIKAAIRQTQDEAKQYLLDNGLSEEEINNPLSPKRSELMLKFRPNIENRLKATWAGLTGHERTTANQLWENVGVQGVPFLGFATEIALDPLMWKLYPAKFKIAPAFKGTTPAGIVTKAAETEWRTVTGYQFVNRSIGTGASALGRGAIKIPQVANAVDFVVDKTGDISKAAYDMFIAKSKIPELAEKVDTYLNRRKWLSSKGIQFGINTRNAILKEAKKSGKAVEDVERSIVSHIEIGSQATAGEMEIAKIVKSRLERTLTEMTDAGVPISSLGMARREKIDELYKSLAAATEEQKYKILDEIATQGKLAQKEIEELRLQLHSLEIDVAHWSADENITNWKISARTIDNDLGSDFGSESAALARKQDISKGKPGKVYYLKISPRKVIDLTDQAEQLQYWDNPDAVLDTIYKSGVITKPEYDELKALIPRAEDSKYNITPQVAKPKVKISMVSSPSDEEGLLYQVNLMRKTKTLTADEIDAITNVHAEDVIIPADKAGNSIKLRFNANSGRYEVYKIEGELPQVTSTAPVFQSDKFFKERNQWYTNFRSKLTNKGYDSIKYYALEDSLTPTYKVLTSKIINKVAKGELRQQEKIASMITKKEADIEALVNKAVNTWDMPVSKSEIAETARRLGVNLTEAREFAQLQKARELGYFPRFTTREAEKFLRNASKSKAYGATVWNPRIKNALERRTKDFTIEEWNEFCRTNGVEDLGGVKIKEYFMRDPAYVGAAYEVRAAKAITSAEFLQDTIKTFGKTGSNAPVGWMELPEEIIKLYPQAKGVVFDPEVLKEVTRITEHYINPNASGPILQAVDAIQNSWRKWTLVWFPKYHLRNMVGNLWNNWLADIDPKAYNTAQAIQIYRKYRGTGGAWEKVALVDLDAAGLKPQMADDIIASAEEMGVLGHGWYAADIERGINQQLNRRLIDRAQSIGTTVENNARLAHYISKMEGGMTSAEAAQSVKKFLFDYSDLTAFERDVMRRLFPFYTWTRKNIPLQLQQAWEQPQKFAPLAIPMRMRDEEDLVKLKYARPDLYERLPIEFKRTVDTVTYIPMEGLIPAGDLAKMVRPHELLFELLTPYLRVPIEMYMNKSMYFESEIQKYPQETQEVWRMDVPVKIKYILTSILPQARLISEIDKIVRKQEAGKEPLTTQEFAFSQSLSSIYKVDLKELRNRALSAITKDVDTLKKGAASAHHKGREDEVKRIRETYQQMKIIIKDIKRGG